MSTLRRSSPAAICLPLLLVPCRLRKQQRARRRPAARGRRDRRAVRTGRQDRPDGAVERFRRQVPDGLLRLRLLPRRVPARRAADDAGLRQVQAGQPRTGGASAADLHHHRPGARHAPGGRRVRRRVLARPARPDRHRRADRQGGQGVFGVLCQRPGRGRRGLPDGSQPRRLPDGPQGRADRACCRSRTSGEAVAAELEKWVS